MLIDKLPFKYRIRILWNRALILFHFDDIAKQDEHFKEITQLLNFATCRMGDEK